MQLSYICVQDGYCKVKNVTATAQMTGFVNVTSGDLGALKAAIAAHGPISVAIDASHRSLAFYANGVYYEPNCGKDIEAVDILLSLMWSEFLKVSNVLPKPHGPMGRRWSPFPIALSQTPAYTVRPQIRG